MSKILLKDLSPLTLEEIIKGETFSPDEAENIRLRRNKNIPNKCIRALFHNLGEYDNMKMDNQTVLDTISELELRGDGIKESQVYQGMEDAIVLLLAMPETNLLVVKTKQGREVISWRLQEQAFDQDEFLAEEEAAHLRQNNLFERRGLKVGKALRSGLLNPDNGVGRLDKINEHRRLE